MAQSNIKESKETVLDRKLKIPQKFAVVFHNNDFAPFDFVQLLISLVFKKSAEESHQLTVQIHKNNKAKIAIFPFEIAQAKQKKCQAYCKEHKFPIKITLEPENE